MLNNIEQEIEDLITKRDGAAETLKQIEADRADLNQQYAELTEIVSGLDICISALERYKELIPLLESR